MGMAPLVRPFCRRHDIGQDVEVLRAERRAETAEARDHFVEDEQDAVLVADRAQGARGSPSAAG
jgi:hypothetical protein